MQSPLKKVTLILGITCLLIIGCQKDSQPIVEDNLSILPVDGMKRAFEVICIDGVEYIFKYAGIYGGAITVKFNSNSTVSQCDS